VVVTVGDCWNVPMLKANHRRPGCGYQQAVV
jgi:hypothetical protein